MATYQDKLDRIITSLSANTGLTNIVAGSKAYQLAEAVAYEQMQLEYQVEVYSKQNSLLQAEGSELDNIGGTFFNVSRLGSAPHFVTDTMRAIKFYVTTGTFGEINYLQSGTSRVGKDIIIPEGTIVEGVTASSSRVRFRVLADTLLSANKSEGFVSAELVQGTDDAISPNVLKVHNFQNYSQSVNGLLKVTNPIVIATGRNGESDTNYRYRLVNSLKAFPKTTSQGILDAVLRLSDVSNAFLSHSANGGGTFDIFIQGVTPMTADTTLANAKMALQDCVGPWVSYNVLKPYYTGLSCSLKVRLMKDITNPDALITQIVEVVTNYINNSYGVEFNINTILKIAEQVSGDIASVSYVTLKEYYGAEDARKFSDIDFTANPNYIFFVGQTEKIIVEPIQNAITVTF